jgi:hypothetical protein
MRGTTLGSPLAASAKLRSRLAAALVQALARQTAGDLAHVAVGHLDHLAASREKNPTSPCSAKHIRGPRAKEGPSGTLQMQSSVKQRQRAPLNCPGCRKKWQRVHSPIIVGVMVVVGGGDMGAGKGTWPLVAARGVRESHSVGFFLESHRVPPTPPRQSHQELQPLSRQHYTRGR